jgi:surfeit locus 1 family protein
MTVLILIGATILCGLGVWQWNRHIQRSELNTRILSRMAEPPLALAPSSAANPIDAQQLDYRRVTLQGSFDDSQSILLRNRTYEGATGYHLITPLRLSGSDTAILVDRGWIPLNQSDAQARTAYTTPGEVSIEGVARQSQHGLAGPADPPFSTTQPRLDAWFRVDIERIQQQTPYPLLPIFVEMQPAREPPTRPPLPSVTTDLGLGSHLGYAIQWFSFAIILVVGYVALMLRGREYSGVRSQESE